MANIRLSDANNNAITGLNLVRGGIASGRIRQIGRAPQGWVRVAAIGYYGGFSALIMLSGNWGTGRATTLVAALSNFGTETARLKFNLINCTQGAYSRFRVVKDPDGNTLWLDFYNSATSSPNLGVHDITIVGTGTITIYDPTEVLTEEYTALGEWALSNIASA